MSKKSIHKQVFGQIFGKKYASVLLFLYIGTLSDVTNNPKIAKQ